MPTRTNHSIVTFARPFPLGAARDFQPAGDYDVDDDEELIEGLSFTAYRCVATYIHLPARAAGGAAKQFVPIERADLEALLERDQKESL